MSGLRSVTDARRSRPPAPAEEGFLRTRDPVTSPPLPVPDRFARGQASPKAWPQLFRGAVVRTDDGPYLRWDRHASFPERYRRVDLAGHGGVPVLCLLRLCHRCAVDLQRD